MHSLWLWWISYQCKLARLIIICCLAQFSLFTISCGIITRQWYTQEDVRLDELFLCDVCARWTRSRKLRRIDGMRFGKLGSVFRISVTEGQSTMRMTCSLGANSRDLGSLRKECRLRRNSFQSFVIPLRSCGMAFRGSSHRRSFSKLDRCPLVWGR